MQSYEIMTKSDCMALGSIALSQGANNIWYEDIFLRIALNVDVKTSE